MTEKNGKQRSKPSTVRYTSSPTACAWRSGDILERSMPGKWIPLEPGYVVISDADLICPDDRKKRRGDAVTRWRRPAASRRHGPSRKLWRVSS